jgi:tetratricopeptide (TPR) repeat protein
MRNAFVWVLCIFCAACTTRPGTDTVIPPLPDLTADHTSRLLEALNDAVEENPKVADAHFQRANLYLRIGDWPAALEDINQAIRLDGNNSAYHYVRTQAAQRMGNANMAWESALQAEKLNNQTPEFFRLMGELCQERKDYAKAKQYLEKASEINPSDGVIDYFQAKVAAENGDTARALQAYERAIAKTPSYPETYNRLAEIANASQVHALALQYVRDGLRYDSIAQTTGQSIIRPPARARFYYNGANAYRQLEKPDSAIMWYKKALSLDTALYMANYHIGLLAFNARNYQEAKQRFEKVTQQKPGVHRLNYFLGMCYLAEGRQQDALVQFDTARKLDARDYRSAEQYKKLSGTLAWLRYLAKQDSASASSYRQLPRRKLEMLAPIVPEVVVPKVFQIKKDSTQNH